MDPLLLSFAPVVRADTRLIVCGSLPGAQSLAERRYYANPRNQFWRLIGAVIERDLGAMAYPARLAALLDAGVGLWDVVASGTRRGSLDAAIRIAATHDLPSLLAAHPAIRAVAFNGGKAGVVGRRILGEAAVAQIALPSSSPAYTLAYQAKLGQWLSLREWL